MSEKRKQPQDPPSHNEGKARAPGNLKSTGPTTTNSISARRIG